MSAASIRLFLCGDVMTGRGIDQILPHPCDPALHEPHVRDARDYVGRVERRRGVITRPVSFDYVWGDALRELERFRPDARIVNLETAVTTSDDAWDKEVLYRMNPRNIGCLLEAGIDCCCLANNHTLDWGYDGLEETLRTLDAAGIRRAGAGRHLAEAAAPAALDLAGTGRLFVFALGSPTSGIPWDWASADNQLGVNLLEEISIGSAERVAGEVRRLCGPGDVAVVSIHWGSNWGYHLAEAQIEFAHHLIESGADIIHGHSSHHVRTIEVYRGRPILYGCGDFLTDYEGIRGHEAFRGDLALMVLMDYDPRERRLIEMRLVPLQSRRLRLSRVSAMDAAWLCDSLNGLAAPFATSFELNDDNSIRASMRQKGVQATVL